LEDILETVILLLGIALFIAAGYGDVKTLRIPNLLVAAVAALGLFRLIALGDLYYALYTVGASVIVLIATFLLFWRGLVGGGDAKLITAAALLVGYYHLLDFALLMSICGALLSLAMLVIWWRSEQSKPSGVPYGAAIAAGAIVTLLFHSSLTG
jgi:prepilin peptidase CpaA